MFNTVLMCVMRFCSRIKCFSGAGSFLKHAGAEIISTVCRLKTGSRTGQEGKVSDSDRFTPADLSALLKGQIRCGCGLFVALRDYISAFPSTHWRCCLSVDLPGWGPDFHMDSVRCLQLCREVFTPPDIYVDSVS